MATSNSRKANPSTAMVVLLLLVAGGWGATSSSDDTTVEEPAGADVNTCTDGIDNDGDGAVDSMDLECDVNNPMYDGDENGDA